MDRRAAAETVATKVTAAITAAGISAESLAQATDIPVSVLRERLDLKSDFTLPELRAVGGFFRIDPVEFLIGAA